MYYSLKLEVKGTNIKRFLLLLGAKHKNAKREKKKKDAASAQRNGCWSG